MRHHPLLALSPDTSPSPAGEAETPKKMQPNAGNYYREKMYWTHAVILTISLLSVVAILISSALHQPKTFRAPRMRSDI